MTIKPDDDGDGVLCHVRDSRNGEGKVDEGNTAKPKVFCEDMLSTSPQNHKEKTKKYQKTKTISVQNDQELKKFE